jgi:hypothetical protein
MDTREKIVAPDAAAGLLKNDAWTVVEGLFDPLTVAQAKRLAALCRDGRKLLAVILPGDNPLLSADARSILIAALRVVDAVTIAGSARQIIASFNSELELIEDIDADAARSTEFVNFVLERHRLVAKL